MPAWWFDADAGGGWLGASGSHLIDAGRVWLGEITSASAMVEALASDQPRRSADDTFTLMLRTTTGARTVLHQSAAVHGPRVQVLRIAGSEGSAWLDESWTLWRAGRTGEPERVEPDADLTAPAVDLPAWAGPFAARGAELRAPRQAEHFADAIDGVTRAEYPRAATFDDGIAVQRVIDAARASSLRGRRIDFAS